MKYENSANIYLFKVNNRNTRKKVWNMFRVIEVALVILLTLNIFPTFF